MVWSNLETLDTTLCTSKKVFCACHTRAACERRSNILKIFVYTLIYSPYIRRRGARKLSLLWSIFYAARLFRMHAFHLRFIDLNAAAARRLPLTHLYDVQTLHCSGKYRNIYFFEWIFTSHIVYLQFSTVIK